MKEVKVRFHNIQSHADTAFSFIPGVNFIISPDNNVGKSTIFVTLSTVAKMPRVSNEDLADLLRDNANVGYAMFTYKCLGYDDTEYDESVILWLNRDGNQVRGFIEIKEPGRATREARAPKSFFEALGIKVTKDGEILNIIDANSVQLFVDSGKASDSIISDILIDEEVERIKGNVDYLTKYVTRDARAIDIKLTDIADVLSGISYNDLPDEFNDEYTFIECAAETLDLFESVEFSNINGKISEACCEIRQITTALELIEKLSAVKFYSDANAVNCDDIDTINAATHCIKILMPIVRRHAESNDKTLVELQELSNILENVQVAIEVLQKLDMASACCSRQKWDSDRLRALMSQRNAIAAALRKDYKIIDCPLKGKVYGETCIPVID